ncbi:hypothetical protein D3C87_1270600 [compost metagenome]
MLLAGLAGERGVDDHGQGLEPRVALDLAREREAVHLGHFQVGQHQRDLVADGLALGGGEVGDAAQHLPRLLARLGHHHLHAHRLQAVLDQAARQRRVIGGQHLGAGAQVQRRAHGGRVHVRLAGGQHIAQDLLHIEHLHQARVLAAGIELGDAGHQPALDAGLGRDHLAPVQAHDFFHGFHGKALRGARVLGHQHDVQAGFRLALQQARQVDHGNHLATDVGHAEDGRLGAHHGGHGGHHQDFADLEHVDAEQFGLPAVRRVAKSEQQQFELIVVGQVRALVNVSHRAGHRACSAAGWGGRGDLWVNGQVLPKVYRRRRRDL